MNTHVAPPSGKLTVEEFLEFIEDRPREERWQLVDGEPFMMMSPATRPHQMIGRNLARLLDNALEKHRKDLVALQEIGIRSEEHPDFLAVADVAVVDAEVENEIYGTSFYLAAEILSDSNTRESISRKRSIYRSRRPVSACWFSPRGISRSKSGLGRTTGKDASIDRQTT